MTLNRYYIPTQAHPQAAHMQYWTLMPLFRWSLLHMRDKIAKDMAEMHIAKSRPSRDVT